MMNVVLTLLPTETPDTGTIVARSDGTYFEYAVVA